MTLTENQLFDLSARRLFERGIKPTMYLSVYNENYKWAMENDYPYIRVRTYPIEFKNALFFHNEEAKERFLKKHEITQDWIILNDKIIGEGTRISSSCD